VREWNPISALARVIALHQVAVGQPRVWRAVRAALGGFGAMLGARPLSRATFDELLTEALPIREFLDAGPFDTVAARVDASRRPDVADLVRVHTAEGAGRVSTGWVYGVGADPVRVFLVCRQEAPVRASFTLAFELPRDRDLLYRMADRGFLGLVPDLADDSTWEETPEAGVAEPMLMLEIPTVGELRTFPGRTGARGGYRPATHGGGGARGSAGRDKWSVAGPAGTGGGAWRYRGCH
jgi:hypothetical protein